MSKLIKLTQAALDECRKEFETLLKQAKLADGRITFNKSFLLSAEKAKIYFTPSAYVKMLSLIDGFESEVAWHAIAKRGDEEKNEYIISDILVYPQSVTGVTVDTDQVEYQSWLYSHDDDIFSNIRSQMHSHVRMGVSPSATDLTGQGEILSQLKGDMFYIFMIWNKSRSKDIKIYDLKKNILFETADTTVDILFDNGETLSAFLSDAQKIVKKKQYCYSYQATQTTTKTQPQQVQNPSTTITTSKTESKDVGKGLFRKGKRRVGKQKITPWSYSDEYGYE